MTPKLWPPQCCVPAFVHAALLQLGVDYPYPDAIPKVIGIRVKPEDVNPLDLALADRLHPPSIRGSDAERQVNRMCCQIDSDLRLRRVPFKAIIEELWMDVLDEAMSRGAVVGLGVDYNMLMAAGPSDCSAQHVLRVLSLNNGIITLFDDSGESNQAVISVDPDRVREAVLSVEDGLWIINKATKLNFQYTLPWQD
ncbi:hypothetical protein OQ496_14065 [Acetobacter suratthaniensis]|uniref:Uncharacterized protein n=1 Tax=Acetobacter suratthaniensis TaxID=1502841 RepID=A0ABS3LQ52_9PROT|nr:hypothetical protein [Acetobacter suratthaniensis]MBO1329503.1 hypothetical protein [Acetobacter suratthaniensis]MCX2567569.1 hypothetical protein [Acetobacter suratthaniensis]